MKNIRSMSIKEARYYFKDENNENKKFIIVSSYENDIEFINPKNKLILVFDDIKENNGNSFNETHAQKIEEFINKIDFEKEELYVCCDAGVSRSSAIRCAILRKYGENDIEVWENWKYTPNTYIFEKLCKYFNIDINSNMIKQLEEINKNAFKKQMKINNR